MLLRSQNPKITFIVRGFTIEVPKTQYNGNGRHFFGAPREDLFTGKDIILEVKRQDEEDPESNALKKSLKMHLDKISTRLVKLCKQKKINIADEFAKLDPAGKEVVNSIKFEYLLSEKIGLDLKECQILIEVLDHKHLNLIGYPELLKWLRNKGNIEIYFERLLK